MNYQQTNGSYYHAQNQQAQNNQYLPAQHASYRRSCSSSNLRLYAQQQQQQQANYNHYAAQHATNAMSSRSTSNLRQLAYAQQQQAAEYSSRMASRQSSHLSSQQAAQSGIVLQSLSNLQNMKPTAITKCNSSANPAVSDTKSMTANLALYSKYTQLQLNHALSQYPVWLQKEYMRRLQRQYEELYVVEDPKICHWSAICPRDGLSPTQTPRAVTHTSAAAAANKENESRYKYQFALSSNNLMGILSESASEEAASVDYLSESVTLSPSPYAYSAYNASPQKESKFAFDEAMFKTSPSPPTPVEVQSGSDKSSNGLLTCFQILDSMEKEENTANAVICEILEEEEEEVDGLRVEEVCISQTPRMVSPASDEDAASAYYAANVYQQQQQQQIYQQAVQRWYQQKHNEEKQRKQQYQQLLVQQAIHQQYVMQQNKYVAQYVSNNKVQQAAPCANMNAQQAQQQQAYYAQNNNAPRSAYSTQQRFCA